jgi:hypothetical protein
MAAPVETKVKASTAASYLATVAGLAVLEAVNGSPLLLSPLPDWIEPVILGLVPAVLTFLSGWLSKHTPRTETEA